MKCTKVIYINPEDPRIFVYKQERYPWAGVTLNFAHWKSFLVLAATLFPFFAACISGSLGWKPGVVIFLLCFGVELPLVYVRGAARDLRRYPGKRAAR